MKLFAERLRELRKEKGLSMRKMANRYGLTDSAYCRYEKGTAQPRLEVIVDLAKFYNVSVGYLLGTEDI